MENLAGNRCLRLRRGVRRAYVRDETVDVGKLVALEGVREFPSRVKCATLAWHALNSAILQAHEPVTTE